MTPCMSILTHKYLTACIPHFHHRVSTSLSQSPCGVCSTSPSKTPTYIEFIYFYIYILILIGWQDLMWCFVPIKIHVYTYGFCASKVATLRSAPSFDATQRAVLWLAKAFSKKPDMFYISAMYIYILTYIYTQNISIYLQFIYIYSMYI